MKTATEVFDHDQRHDRRRFTAQALASALFDEISDLIPDDLREEVFVRLQTALYQNGVLLVQDSERSSLGLEPCDEKGWTPSERVKLHRDRLDALAMIAASPIKVFDPE